MGLSNSRVAREWTHGRDKRGSNFYAADGTIYSYGSHFPIARFYTLADGKRVCLFTAREYSSSTARHKSYVSRAIPSAVPVFVVPAVARFGADLDKAGHRANLKAYREKIAGLVKSSRESRRRADTRLGFLRQAEAVARDATEYARAFRLGLRGAVGTGVGEAEREALRQAGEVAGAAASARRLARRAAENSRWEASRERERVENADKFAKWKAGEHNDTLGLSAFPVAFRFRPGSESRRIVQTSKGAEFSVADAARAWPRLCELRQAGGVYRPAVGTVAADAVLDISGFAVSQVSPAGVVVGCHNVSWEAVDELARELGVCDVTA